MNLPLPKTNIAQHASFKKIGLFDSGLGGLSVLQALRELSAEEYVYIADTAHLPYGTKNYNELFNRAHIIITFLLQQNVDAIVIACHTICSTVLPAIKQLFPKVYFFEMIEPAIHEALEKTKNNTIGIIATSATIMSHAHKKALLIINPSLRIVEQACPLLVPLIEQPVPMSNKLIKTLEEYLTPLIASNTDTIILGCTHYTLVKNEIQHLVGPQINLVSSDINISTLLTPYLSTGKKIATLRLMATGDVAAFQEKIIRVFGLNNSVIYLPL